MQIEGHGRIKLAKMTSANSRVKNDIDVGSKAESDDR